MQLNYNELVQAYNEGLHNTLRNFKPGPDFLDTWVPDEDSTKSLFGIFEAAETSNEETLSVLVPKDVASTLNREWMKKMSNQFGELSFKDEPQGTLASLKFSKGGTLEIHPVYREMLQQVGARITHEGALTNLAPHQTLITVSEEGTTLSFLLNERHEIIAAKHQGATGTVRVLLDQLCAETQAKPFQEASEHGLLRVEFKLRDKTAPSPVQGIITPQNADPAFKLPLKLLRKAYQEYCQKQGISFQRNFYTDPLMPTFVQMTLEQKIQKIQTLLLECCRELGLQDKDIEVVDMKPDARAVIQFRQDSSKPKLGPSLLRLERMLKEKFEPRIELVMESLEDRNKRKGRGEKLLAMEDEKKANKI